MDLRWRWHPAETLAGRLPSVTGRTDRLHLELTLREAPVNPGLFLSARRERELRHNARLQGPPKPAQRIAIAYHAAAQSGLRSHWDANMTKQNSGFTLIELMIVVAIMGILAAMAMSAYQTYIVRTQVAEGVNMAGSAKTPIADAFNMTGTPPADRVAAGMTPAPTDTQGKFVSQVSVVNGRLDVTFGKDAHQDIFGRTLSVTPYLSGSGSVYWRCGTAGVPVGAVEMAGGGITALHIAPTIDTRYLPGACRN
jgi:type IV pilus assembly protein PilA